MKPINYQLNSLDLLPLPSDEKLERMVLGLLVDAPGLTEQVYRLISMEGVFYHETHAQIWEAINKLMSLKMVPNKSNLEGHFTRAGDRDKAVAVAAISIYAGEITMLKQYCLRLFEMAVLRNVIRIGYNMNQKGYARHDALEVLADASNGIGKLYQAIAGMKSKSIADGVDELSTELTDIASSPDGMLGIKGSLPHLNRILKGYRKGNLIVIGASSGEGKTTFALQEISHIVLSGKPVGVVSLEMTQGELLLKIACERENIPVEKALDGTLSTEEMGRLGRMLEKIKKWPLQISETPGLKIGEVKASFRMWKNRFKIQIGFIDHMHLIRGDYQYSSPEQQFTDIANQIKELAKEMDMPIVSLAQLARKDLTEKRMHVMTDLKYAGGIEQAADVIIMIFRPEHHNIPTTSDGESTAGKAVIKVEKLRLLRPGSVSCYFDGLRFTEVSKSHLQTLGNWKPVKQFDEDVTEPSPF